MRSYFRLYLIVSIFHVAAFAADVNEDLRKAAEKGDLARVRALVTSGADPTSTDKKGRNAIDLAAEKKRTGIVEFLRLNRAATGFEVSRSQLRTDPLVVAEIDLDSGDMAAAVRVRDRPVESQSVYFMVSASWPNPYLFLKRGDLRLVDASGKSHAPWIQVLTGAGRAWLELEKPPAVITQAVSVGFNQPLIPTSPHLDTSKNVFFIGDSGFGILLAGPNMPLSASRYILSDSEPALLKHLLELSPDHPDRKPVLHQELAFEVPRDQAEGATLVVFGRTIRTSR